MAGDGVRNTGDAVRIAMRWRQEFGSNIFSEAHRKSDQVYQNLMKNTIALNHKLDELIESLKSLPKETNEEDLAKHEYRECHTPPRRTRGVTSWISSQHNGVYYKESK
ncbi:hypothetical protein Tco_0054431 [Tanacetum coccineum]